MSVTSAIRVMSVTSAIWLIRGITYAAFSR
jgi:hypothetical protein